MIEFDPKAHPPQKSQAMLSQLVVPRPIAMISTCNGEGRPNVAPMSYYMAVTGKPMLVAVSMGALRDSDGLPKHTYENAMATGDFVVNVTTERFREQIETVAMEYPADRCEADDVGWRLGPSQRVTAPSIMDAPAHLECEVRQVIDLGEPGVAYSAVHLVIAEVVWIVMDESVCSPDYRVDPLQLAPIGRLGFPYFVQAVPEGVYELPRYAWTANGAEG
jgi:flavin reductase (DIM6/NTAB) family NADH-FMN oxidoreductase RutF